MKTRSLIPLLTAALLAACASVTNPVTGQRELTVMDEKAEIAEGVKGHQEVIKEYGVADDAALRAYVDGVGQKLATASHRAKLKWTFTVLDSPEANAFALPGGYIYITRGIMAYMESEADMAEQEVRRIMTTPPDWAPDLPLDVDTGWDRCYSK